MARNRINRERTFEQYGLKSLFFYRKLEEGQYRALFSTISAIDCSQYPFPEPEAMGITGQAMQAIQGRGIPLCHVFCHPGLLVERPTLLRYYRGVAAISQKGLGRLAGSSGSTLARFERGEAVRPLTEELAKRLASVVNTLVSGAVLELGSVELDTLRSQVLMTAGAQADGSWRQVPGKAASDAVKELVVGDLLARGHLTGIPREEIPSLSRFSLSNGYKMVFGSEPDISIFDSEGREVAVIEIKGGIDPAGALERYGAAKKSFDDALSRNPSVITVYLAAAITPTVRQRIATDRLVRETFDLSEVLASEAARTAFLNQLYWWLHLSR